MTQDYRLKSAIGADRETDPDDVWIVKNNLKNNGYFSEPPYGVTPYPDQFLFDAIKQYQKENDLKVDGIMLPDGETERHMLENFAAKSPTMWCRHCQGPHGGVYSPTVCFQCWQKGLR